MNLIKERSKEAVYANIIFDKYRNTYYRIAKHKSNSNNLKDFKFSIMILDKNFNILGEQIFNNLEYNISACFVSKNGLLLKKQDDLSGITKYDIYKVNL